jgi:tetratricopeptide (TPR) repeat protein
MRPKKPNRPATVRAWRASIAIPTYLPAPPDKNPMFLEKRVYQGSSGRVYPLPFTDRIAERPTSRSWQAIWIENEFLRVLVLPEIGGRIHRILDKTNSYDLIYHQPVIKPALVGLAGPWISGGIEFNWPQHHRPATFLPVDTRIERHADGSMTVWCGDHDPMCRMKGMHGVCLHPGGAYVELKVRAYNRTPLVQTFLWWANVATRVHEAYQSFFPPDVTYVADHARRSMSGYPLAQGSYYGVNYGQRARSGIPADEVPPRFLPPHFHLRSQSPNRISQIANRKSQIPCPPYPPNDLSFYANIPVPTSYMCVGSREDYFGGYDFEAQAGIVHIANHHIAPGKKQWTWGNHDFGYAWDRNLTDPDARGVCWPYIEIMAGVYTDNQPDFSFLHPGETKTWSQWWYPIQKIGPAQQANLDAAVCMNLEPTRFRLGISVTRTFRKAVVRLERSDGSDAAEWHVDLAPGKPFTLDSPQAIQPWKTGETVLRVLDRHGREIISCQPRPRAKRAVPSPATEPPAPRDIATADELFLTGLHLDQYRHATRCPTPYWREALRRDPLDGRCNNALGLWHLKRGEFVPAEACFRQAIQRLTCRNANPADGEPFYNLGICLRAQSPSLAPVAAESRTEARGQSPSLAPFGGEGWGEGAPLIDEAYDAFYKSTWNQAWAAAGYHALAELDCRRGNWTTALEHLNRSLRFNADNLRARDLKVIVLRKLGCTQPSSCLSRSERRRLKAAAKVLLRETLALDPLDWWARHLNGEPLTCDLQTRLDLAHDCARAGLYSEAIQLLASARTKPGDLPDQSWGALPLVHYTLGWLHRQIGDAQSALRHFNLAAALPSDYCFPARLEEIAILEAAMRANPLDAKAPYYLGNLWYDRRRHAEAIRLWERSVRLDPACSTVWRNLGIGYFNIEQRPAKARAAFNHAFKVNPADARLLFERDQLWKRLGEKPTKRLRALERHLDLVRQRDDLSVELCALYNQTGQSVKAFELVSRRHFQPWEGGEGGPLGQWSRSHQLLGRTALARGEVAQARGHFNAALTTPDNLGEASHLLANRSDLHYWLGCALAALGDMKQAREHWLTAATFRGDFQGMRVRAFSEMTYYSGLAWGKLGQHAKSAKLFRALLAYARRLRKSETRIDYFATSLPTLLLFDDDLQSRQETTAVFLEAQAWLGLNRKSRAQALLRDILRRDPNHPLAADLAAGLDKTR